MDVDKSIFGKTQVSQDEIFDVVNVDAAIEVALQAGIENATDRIHRFLASIPDLLNWLDTHGRQYPWRNTTDSWKIYATEILLQRTRADAVDGIYDDFFTAFTAPEDLQQASEDSIRQIVRPLGFVNHRTRSLQEAGDMICEGHNGEVPASIDALKQPWRVGDYTARATLVFAMGEPIALVDSNFARVFERVLGYDMPRQPHKSKEVYEVLDSLVPSDPAIARAYNLAILDLGALICTPNNPNCSSCPISSGCTYFHTVYDV